VSRRCQKQQSKGSQPTKSSWSNPNSNIFETLVDQEEKEQEIPKAYSEPVAKVQKET
jgi:hypothetical protein